MRGWRVPPGLRHKDRRYVQSSEVSQDVPVEIVQGASGFLVKPAFFDEQLLSYDGAPGEMFFVDDLWISGNLARRGVPRLVPASRTHFVRIGSLSTLNVPGLVQRENRDGRNNLLGYQHFLQFWRLFDTP